VPRAPRRLLRLCAVACVGTLAACGAGNTKADFVSRADAICETAARATRAIPPPVAAAGVAARLHALGLYLARVTPIVDGEVSGLRALTPPSEGRTQVDRYLSALTASARQYRQLAQAAAGGDAATAARLEAALAASPAPALARAYGLRSCAGAEATTA
jgi:hypothetical protein